MIVEQQIDEHRGADMLWAMHGAINVISAALAMLGLLGCEAVHDTETDIHNNNGDNGDWDVDETAGRLQSPF